MTALDLTDQSNVQGRSPSQRSTTIMTAPTPEPLGRALYTVEEAALVLSFSRAHVYREIRAGRLKALKSGRSTRVSARAIVGYVELLEQEAEEA
jgi:excisionase family DNA binding protein